MKQPLAIVGASARSAAASALRAGFQPVTADLFADADLRQFATATPIAPYPDGLLDWLRTIEPPAWIYTGALENHAELVDQMGWVAPLWGNPGDVLTRVRSPWELGDALRNAGLLFPEMRTTAEGLPRDGSWLVKSYRGASGSGVREWGEAEGETRRGGEGENRSIGFARGFSLSPCLPLSLSPCLVFQRRVDGTPAAAIFVAADGAATLLGVTRQLVGETWLGSHGFQYCGSIGPLPLPEETLATIARIGNTLAEQFELIGLFGVDMIVDGDRVWAIEVNPRYTASVEVVERFSGVHAIAAHAAACQGEPDWRLAPQPPASSLPCHGKAILFANRNIMISRDFADATLAEALRTPWPALADISPVGTAVEFGRPVLTLFAAGGTPEEVEHRLRQRAGDLEETIYSQ